MKQTIASAVNQLRRQRLALLRGTWKQGMPKKPNSACAVYRVGPRSQHGNYKYVGSTAAEYANKACRELFGFGDVMSFNDMRATSVNEILEVLEYAEKLAVVDMEANRV